MARPIETTTLRMNRTLGRLRLLIEASAIILTKRRQPRIDAGGRRRGLVCVWCPGAATRPLEKPHASVPHNSACNSHVNLLGFEMGALVFQRFLGA